MERYGRQRYGRGRYGGRSVVGPQPTPWPRFGGRTLVALPANRSAVAVLDGAVPDAVPALRAAYGQTGGGVLYARPGVGQPCEG